MKEIFKAYDVRGAYPDKINEPIARRIGLAIAEFLDCRNALVGHDMRRSSPPLSEALIEGLRTLGVDVTAIGQASSPLVYFAGAHHDCAVAVTASHNPPPDNGMKICGREALPIGSANGLLRIAELAMADRFTPAATMGSLASEAPRERFVSSSLEALHIKRPFKVVVDAANGMGGLDYEALSHRDTPLQIVPLYFEPDDSFPHHEANPLNFDTLEDLQAAVRRERADLGLALDGDGDRCFFVDERGEILTADLITALIAEDILSTRPGATILHDLRSSRVVREEIEEAGGRAVECRVGHAFIKQALRDEAGVFAGELSGHFYFKESSYAENTFLALFRVLNLLDDRRLTLSEAALPLRRYHSSGEINSRVRDTRAVLDELEKRYDGGQVSHLDGLKISFDQWWFNARPSNTEPVLRLVLEASTRELMERQRDELLEIIRDGSA
ncbi:MAG: phosphomannomutase/phosphoglucomutase [Acidobacteriota bacterium]|nr:MAG: phosphomannomutase/phosphoglucomutase [Acidobacteriota bacterium]